MTRARVAVTVDRTAVDLAHDVGDELGAGETASGGVDTRRQRRAHTPRRSVPGHRGAEMDRRSVA